MAAQAAASIDSYDFFGSIEDDSERDKFFGDNLVTAAPSEELLTKMEQFVSKFSMQLKEMEVALDEKEGEVWNADRDPIGVSFEVKEKIHPAKLISSDNTLFSKVMTVFSVVMCEIEEMSKLAEKKFYGPLAMFGRSPVLEDSEGQEAAKGEKPEMILGLEVQMGAFLPILQDLSNFIRRLNSLIVNLLQQLSSLYHERTRLYATTFKHINLNCVFESLGSALRVLATIDSIIWDNEAISEGWLAYKRMIKFVRSDPSKFNLDSSKLKSFEGCLLILDRTIVSGRSLEHVLSSDFGSGLENGNAIVSGNRVLYEEFNTWLKFTQDSYESEFSTNAETTHRLKLVEFHCVYVLFRRVFRSSSKPDTKQFKRMWELQKKCPMVYLYGKTLWFAAEFLTNHAPLPEIYSSLSPPFKKEDLLSFRQEFVKSSDSSISRRAQEFYYQMCVWMVRFESELMDPKSKHLSSLSAVVNARSKLCITGLILANSIQNALSVCICSHLKLEVPFRKDSMRALCVMIECLKVIQGTFHRRSAMMAENLNHMIGQTQFVVKRYLLPVKAKIEAIQNPDDTKLDILAAINMSVDLLNSAHSSDRNVILQLMLSPAQMKSIFKDNEKEEIKYQTWKLGILGSFQSRLLSWCSTSYLYFAVDLVPRFLQDMYSNSDQVYRLPYLLCALRDAAPMLKSSPPVYASQISSPIPMNTDNQPHLVGYSKKISAMIISEIVTPLCREVETDLRLHIHSVALQQESLRNKQMRQIIKYESNVGMYLFSLMQLKPIRGFGEEIDIRQRVSHYLDTTFYNLNTLALHDWKMYAEMRNLANEKYGLVLAEVHLPGNSHYSEGLDVLEIMRNIHIFVAKFNYNLNTQVFVERAFDQKHVNSIDISHIANSIRTHGMGITNTTVNFTYQFLCQKFLIFSEFLFDDHIKSRLMKDVRYFKEKKDELEQRYPYDRADKFNKDIRKLGVTEDGRTYLDQFRQLVTEIGNALGYVRMVRSGVLNTVSAGIKFVPDLTKIINFTNEAIDAKLSADTIASAKNLDGILSNLSKNFASGTDYFRILVAVFVDVLSASDQQHLKYFHIIVPPLTLNFVEKMLEQKERLGKKGKLEASFTDDGFALGLAYILKLLGQYESFDALHWFESVSAKLKLERAKLTAVEKSKKLDDLQTLQLSLTRLNNIQSEFEMLFFSFSGARIFFRDVDKKKAEPAESAPSSENVQVADSSSSNDVAPSNGVPSNGPPVTFSAPPPPVGSFPPGPPVGAFPPGPPIGAFPPGPPIGLMPGPPPAAFPGPPIGLITN